MGSSSIAIARRSPRPQVAAELGGKGVRVNAISPGGVVTGIFAKNAGVETLERARQAAESTRKIGVVEVLGEHAGWLVLQAGMAVCADARRSSVWPRHYKEANMTPVKRVGISCQFQPIRKESCMSSLFQYWESHLLREVVVTHQGASDAVPRLSHAGLYDDQWRKTQAGWQFVHRTFRPDHSM